ncbi:MAG TPA: stage III sporulation protein AF [Candidatus Dorea merdavium]|nr:stage III sporulation protein AF [Massilistercora timonensis]HIY55799.1 stage III sporulation protein AF [Candidatus Dorea merdavium]
MFAYLYEWIRNVAFYLVLVTALLHVLPRSGYQKYIRFFTGLVLILLVLAPVLKLFQMEEELRDAYRDDSWLEQLEEIEGVEEIQIGDH